MISGESRPPDEHTLRVRARKQQPPTNISVHDRSESVAPASTSTDLSESSRRQRKKERDRQAERRAMQVVIGAFVGLGGAGLVAANLLLEETPPSPVAPVANPPPKPVRPVLSSAVADTPDIPAIRAMKNEGLTIAAEGLPLVDATEQGDPVARAAAVETCRFAYGIWEFSPNRRFRFLTTCPALEGQVLVGAYEVQGTVLKMSPLDTGEVVLASEFEVERPSKMRTTVMVRASRPFELQVEQAVNIFRPGLEGEAFRDTYAPKNTLRVVRAEAPAPKAPPPPPPTKANDPLLDLLRKPNP